MAERQQVGRQQYREAAIDAGAQAAPEQQQAQLASGGAHFMPRKRPICCSGVSAHQA